MPFVPINLLSTSQRILDHVSADMDIACVYLDYVVVFSSNLEEHSEQISAVTNAIASEKLKVKLVKCHLAQRQIGSLGHLVDEEKVLMASGKAEAIKSISSPMNVTQVPSFQIGRIL